MPQITFTLTDDEYARLVEQVEHTNDVLQAEGQLYDCPTPECWSGPLDDVNWQPDGSPSCPVCGHAITPGPVPPVCTPAGYARDALLDDLGLMTDPSRLAE